MSHYRNESDQSEFSIMRGLNRLGRKTSKDKNPMGKELLEENRNRLKRKRREPTGKMMTSCLLAEYAEFLAISFGHSDTIRTFSKSIQSMSQITNSFEITMSHACSPFVSKFRQLKKALIVD